MANNKHNEADRTEDEANEENDAVRHMFHDRQLVVFAFVQD
jgi:hypothetical protein